MNFPEEIKKLSEDTNEEISKDSENVRY